MKKLFTLFLISTTTIFYTQKPLLNCQPEHMDDCVESTINGHLINNNQLKTGDTIWSEDFANGFPSGWTIQDLSGICPWVWSNDGSWGYWNSNNGASAGTAINSTTASNGFLICDTDSANHYNAIANGGQGGSNSGAEYLYLESYFTTNSIDLTGYPAVILEFQQYFRYNNGIDLNVLISTNNVTWDTITVQGNSSNNTASTNADTVRLNISAIAGNQPNVYIKIGWNARVYFWMIDDIKILEADPNDLAINSNYFETLGLRYYKIPTNQLTDINFSATVVNNGANDQPNSKLTMNVNGSSVGSSPTTNLTIANSDSLYLPQGYTPPSTIGQYNLEWVVSSDSTDSRPADNFKSTNIEVTDYIYARDEDGPPGFRGGEDNQSPGDFAFEAGNYFDCFADQLVYNIDVVIGSGTPDQTPIYGIIYIYDSGVGDFVYLETTDEYNVTSADASNNNTITLPLFSPTLLTSGSTYLVMVGCYSEFYYGTSGTSEPQTSFILYGGLNHPTMNQYYTTRTPMVRLNFQDFTGLSELNNNNKLYQNIPNPFTDETTIFYTINNSTNCTLEITTISGKTLFKENLGLKTKGEYSYSLNSKNLSPGIYFYSLITNERRISKRMIIK